MGMHQASKKIFILLAYKMQTLLQEKCENTMDMYNSPTMHINTLLNTPEYFLTLQQYWNVETRNHAKNKQISSL